MKSAGEPTEPRAVVYLARGVGDDFMSHLKRFSESYRKYPSGCKHKFYVVCKGFVDDASLRVALSLFENLDAIPILVDDTRYDIGAYADSLAFIEAESVLFLNTYSEINSIYWLEKLIRNLHVPGVGIVGATGSFESLSHLNKSFPKFPNPHLRTNAFAMRRPDAVRILNSYRIAGKLDTFYIESGPDSITRKILAMDQVALLVGADGRGYAQSSWARSETSRQGSQHNNLIIDNYVREYATANADKKVKLSAAAWGSYFTDNAVCDVF